MNSCAKLLQELTAGTHDEVLAALQRSAQQAASQALQPVAA